MMPNIKMRHGIVTLGILMCITTNTAFAFTIDSKSLDSFIHSSATAPVGTLLRDIGGKLTATNTIPESNYEPVESENKITLSDVHFDPSIIVSIAQKAFALTKSVIERFGLTFDDVVQFLVNGFMWVLKGALTVTDNLLSAALGK